VNGSALAKRRTRLRPVQPVAAHEQILLFRIGEGTYGLGVDKVWEILTPDGVTDLPTPPHQICTALAYRGRRLPLVRLSELFGVPMDRVSAVARVLLTEAPGGMLGLLVDQVLEVAEVPPGQIARVPALATLLDACLFRGLFARGDGIVLLLDSAGLGGLEEVARFHA
jgi:chemotaxis signal transduction protein